MKILKPHTIVPAHLYVERHADRQLSAILNDMGRPGYVLVSRQMGKTNLMINAKRRLEDSQSAFVYIDLSNSHSNARSCFRYIIDTAIESFEHFVALRGAISAARLDTEIPSHIEHTKELRMLLNAISGKLIVILDEIDALTKTSFSDKIFAQIRSTYFSRINYPEFNRLTYVLSGVVDPSEIIKDPKISPFNIGEKIYLNDFSESEYNEFLSKARLVLGESARKRIYQWTAGNPRMTWDICSTVEDLLADGRVVDEKDVDEVVSKIYLRTYDRPPVDHIRDLVRSDRELRGALMSIAYGKARTLPDITKRRLYLAGVVNHIDGDEELVIKNRIIQEAISPDWLHALELQDKGMLRTARDAFQDSLYERAVGIYEKYQEANSLSGEDGSVDLQLLGISYYRTGRYDKAIETFNRTVIDSSRHPDRYAEKEYLTGVSFFLKGDAVSGAKHFQSVIDLNSGDLLFYKARLNLASCLLISNSESEVSEQMYVAIEQELRDVRVSDLDTIEARCICFYNLSKIWSARGDRSKALAALHQGKEIASAELIPALQLEEIVLSNNPVDMLRLHKELLAFVQKEALVAGPVDVDKTLSYNRGVLHRILASAARAVGEDWRLVFDEWLALATMSMKEGSAAISDLLYDVAQLAIGDGHLMAGVRTLKRFITGSTPTAASSMDRRYIEALQYLSILDEVPDERLRYGGLYIHEIMLGGRLSEVSRLDVMIINRYFTSLAGADREKIVTATIDKIEDLFARLDGPVLERAVLGYWKVYALNAAGAREQAKHRADELLEVFSSATDSEKNNSIVGRAGIDAIVNDLREAFYPRPTVTTVRVEPKVGRNEHVVVRYQNGIERTIKYKHAEEAIRKGECILIRVVRN